MTIERQEMSELLTLLAATEYISKQQGTPAPSEGSPEYKGRGTSWDYSSSTPPPDGAQVLQTQTGKQWWRSSDERSRVAEERLMAALAPLTPEEKQQQIESRNRSEKEESHNRAEKEEQKQAADWAKNQPIEAQRLFDKYGLDPDTGAAEILQLVRSNKVDHNDARWMLNLRSGDQRQYQRGRWFADDLGPPKSVSAPIGYIDIDEQEVQNAAAMAVLSHPSPEGIPGEYVVSPEEAASVVPFWSPSDEKSADEAASDLPPVGEGKVRLFRGGRDIDASYNLRKTIESDPEAKHVLDTLSKHGDPYLIGGSVRDSLLGIPSKDIDIEIYGISENDLSNVVDNSLGGKQEQVGKAFGVFKVGDFDIALPRTETAIGDKHTDFDVELDPNLPLDEAARRRDFTINALMYDYKNNEILDFFGGQEDLKSKTIKHVDSDTFVEDPLRVYRAAQFAARFDFSIDPSTKELAQSMDLSNLPKERVFVEFEKMFLKAATPSTGLQALDDMGVLENNFSEIADLKGVHQRDDYHAEGDVFVHTKMTLDKAAEIIKRFPDDKDKMIIMLATLCHDVGKPSTATPDGRAIGHEDAGVPVAQSILDKLTNDKEIIDTVIPLVENHLKPAQFHRNGASDAAFRRLINKHGLKFLDLLSAVSEADVSGRLHKDSEGNVTKPGNDENVWFRERVKEVALKAGTKEGKIAPLISGNDLKDMGFEQGRELGDILRDIQGKQEEGDITTADEAFDYVRDVYKSVEIFTLLSAVEYLFKQQQQGTPAPKEGTPEYQNRGSSWDYSSSTPPPEDAQVLQTSTGKQWWRVGQQQKPEKQTAEQAMMARVGDVPLPDKYIPGMFKDQVNAMGEDKEFADWWNSNKAHVHNFVPGISSSPTYTKPYSTSEAVLLMEHKDPMVAQLAYLRYKAATYLGSDLINHFAENLEMPKGGVAEFREKFPNSKFANEVGSSLNTSGENPTLRLARIVDELYSNTKFSTIHSMAKKDWEGDSTSGYFSWAIQESIGRQFDGDVKYFRGLELENNDDGYSNVENEAFHVRDTFWRGKGMGPVPSQDEIDEYVRTHKALSRWMLDIAFPDSDTIRLYRGTTAKELGRARGPLSGKGDFQWGDKVAIDSNPISSWSMKSEIAFKFAAEQSGNSWLTEWREYVDESGNFLDDIDYDQYKDTVILTSKVHKDDIFTHFGSYAYHGNEQEFVVINDLDDVQAWDWREDAYYMADDLRTWDDPFEDTLPEDIKHYTWTDWAKEWGRESASVNPRLWETLNDYEKEEIEEYWESSE